MDVVDVIVCVCVCVCVHVFVLHTYECVSTCHCTCHCSKVAARGDHCLYHAMPYLFDTGYLIEPETCYIGFAIVVVLGGG